ncbi:MAG: metallophosphoesterase family protein [Spirochaetota bacterium]
MIAIVSDTHGNHDYPERAVEILRQRGVRTVVHCGDVGNPSVVPIFAGFEAWFVIGNVDRDYQALAQAVKGYFGHGHLAMTHRLEFSGKRIAVCHGHTNDLSRIIEEGNDDYILTGHTHRRRDEREHDVRVLNPGALGGLKAQTRSFALLDEERDNVTFFELD